MKMYGLLITFLKNLFYGKEFKMNADKLKECRKIKALLSNMPYVNNCIAIIEPEVEEIAEKLLPQDRWVDKNLEEENLLLPQEVADFFRGGNALDEFDSYECIERYGMLHGKKRRLIIQ